ncbi:NAD(P)-dependent oxidoreductase [Aquabacter sp. P-9]|uniref:NAD(P)-dependent oxidoreductase n=1 Tax=Aquabacter sediminis TaxID=3029197 RepID=UPI00237D7FD6|nr:NAD(P)-dependent oxidoreductase [Aquabacter sp. P-9]MDE1569419.1 NAD(P)-dependent oxidoreductase [Aquabacter sp. P-9]
MSDAAPKPVVGIVGLGIMGMAYARNLLQSGFPVVGFDVAPAALAALTEAGGTVAATPRAVAEASDTILVALASVEALQSVCAGPDGMIHSIRPDAVVVEMSTFPLKAKDYCRDVFAPKGVHVLDCPVSGTGAQAAVRDLVLYASGDEAAATRLRPVFDGFARNTRYVGPFGAGTKLKFVANHLVTIHNLATAEALLLAQSSGLDLHMVFDAIRDGAGNSRMFEVRGPLMIEERYEPATMKMEVYMKDLALISDFAKDVKAPIPLMAAAVPFYVAALAAGRNQEDTAALFGVLKDMCRKD